MYATNQKFSGQRASVGRIVIVCRRGESGGGYGSDIGGTPPNILAGVITEIIDGGKWEDTPMISICGSADGGQGGIPFRECPTEQALLSEHIGETFWTWPPRL